MTEVLRFPINADFDPEQTHVMGEAFDLVCQYAKHRGRSDLETAEGRKLIADRILEKAACGESDPEKLAHYAISLINL